VLIYGTPIKHGYFHNIAVLFLFAAAVALLLHPIGIRLKDSFFFASIGFAAHLFEDALVFNPGYAFFWPLSMQRFGIGIFNSSRDWYGIANEETLIIGIIAVVICVIIRTAYEGKGWIKRSISLNTINCCIHLSSGQKRFPLFELFLALKFKSQNFIFEP
jgi:membrane-bound metal-dependent hydrolase YbcI (DUF457 family)